MGVKRRKEKRSFFFKHLWIKLSFNDSRKNVPNIFLPAPGRIHDFNHPVCFKSLLQGSFYVS